jgi:hypothetical protein
MDHSLLSAVSAEDPDSQRGHTVHRLMGTTAIRLFRQELVRVSSCCCERRCEPPRVCRRLQLLREWACMSKTTNKFAPEVRERAVRMVVDHERDYA